MRPAMNTINVAASVANVWLNAFDCRADCKTNDLSSILMFLEVCHWITVAICAILLIKATVFLEAQTTTYIWVLYKPSIFPLWILHWRCLNFNHNLKTWHKCYIVKGFCWVNRSVHYEIKLWIKTQWKMQRRAKRIRLFVSRRLHFKGLSFHYVGGLVQYWCWCVCY